MNHTMPFFGIFGLFVFCEFTILKQPNFIRL